MSLPITETEKNTSSITAQQQADQINAQNQSSSSTSTQQQQEQQPGAVIPTPADQLTDANNNNNNNNNNTSQEQTAPEAVQAVTSAGPPQVVQSQTVEIELPDTSDIDLTCENLMIQLLALKQNKVQRLMQTIKPPQQPQ